MSGGLLDGINPVQELNGVTPKANMLTGGVDAFFSRTTTAGGTQSFITDALGSTLGLADAAGNVTTQYSYEAYGATTASGTPSDNSYQYTGRENDGTGLYFYRARYYSPELMRFVSEDPIGLAGGINQYAYVGGNPLSNIDPEGLAGQQAQPGGNSYNRRQWDRHGPKPFDKPQPDARPAWEKVAEMFSPPLGVVCAEWSCPENPYQCSAWDQKSPSDFMPPANQSNNPPMGCTCSKLGLAPDTINPPSAGWDDWAAMAQKWRARGARR